MAPRRERPKLDEVERRRAFDELYHSTYNQIQTYCQRRCLDAADAEDAFVEVYLTAWRKLEDALEADPPKSWLYGVAFRVTANQRRARDRSRRLVGRFAEIPRPSAVDSVEDVALAAASLDDVYASLATLAPIDQELIKFAALEGFSYGEIAEMVGLSVHAVRTRLYRARRRLGACLKPGARRDISLDAELSVGSERGDRSEDPETGQRDDVGS